MKYKFLLHFLRSLVYIKRAFWWLGEKTGVILLKFLSFIWRPFAYLSYKTDYLFKKTGVGREKIWWLKRDTLQLVLLCLLFVIALPQTRLFARADSYLAGQKTTAYKLFGQVEDFEIEEVSSSFSSSDQVSEAPTYKMGSLINDSSSGIKTNTQIPELGLVVAGGVAVSRPIIIPGASIAGESRKDILDYVVNPGDSLSSIAYRYGVSVASILWANDLSERSIIRPGDTLKIPPVSGVIHTIKSGDTLSKIATKYGVDEEKIISFNLLKADGKDLVVGEKVVIPDGTMPQTYTSTATTVRQTYATNIPTPASSSQSPSASGFVWPSAARIITQYYSWRHTGLDIAGPMSTAIYAAKSGTVEVSQCGWNGGYGCYIIINHGGGVKTLYGHNSKLLVSVGDYVSGGQTISLMGNTGRVYGVTGIHLHFEVQINGTRRNPLSYVK